MPCGTFVYPFWQFPEIGKIEKKGKLNRRVSITLAD